MAIDEKDKRKTEPTAEEYRRQADEHMDTLKHGWRVFGTTGMFVLAAVIAIILLALAWFVSNNRVSGGGMAISSIDSEFELAAKGDSQNKGAFDGIVNMGSGKEMTIDGETYMATDGGHTSISWAITDDSHMGNESTGTGITPGSKGTLTFYIIARKTGMLKVNLKLALEGLDDTKNAVEDVSAKKLMEGHILLFAGYDQDENSYSGWISTDADPWTMTLEDGKGGSDSHQSTLSREADGSLTWTAQTEKDTAYSVTLYWIWPEVLGEYLFVDQSYIANHPVLFPDEADSQNIRNPKALPNELFTKMASVSETDTPLSNRYFKWAWSRESESEVEKLKNEFAGVVNESTLSAMRNGNYNTITYGNMCSYYNMADQYLGENVRYIKLTVDAQ